MKLNFFLNFRLSTNVIIALVLGIITGLFFGEMVAWMKPIGIAFIKLLQMTVLPYIVVSLIVGIGSLTYEQARNMIIKVGVTVLIIWLAGFLIIFMMPLVFPQLETASFFSYATILPKREINYYELYIPSNPFKSLSATAIPAVVLFCIAVGAALIAIREKETVLKPFKTLSDALTKLTQFVIKLLPLGVFAISASHAGTISIDEFERLQVYLIVYVLVTILLALWILPLFLTTFTPFKYKDVVWISRDALITAFVTGNVFIVLPVITEHAKGLFRKYELTKSQTDHYVDVIIPVNFNFPNLGKIITILFVLFAAWFSGKPLAISEYPMLALSGLLSLFGSVHLSVPFMLDSVEVPSDLYQLFVLAGLITGKFASLLAVMNHLVLSLAATALLTRVAQLHVKKLIICGALTLFVVIAALAGTRTILKAAIDNEYKLDDIIKNMQVAKQVHQNVLQRKTKKIDEPKSLPKDIDDIIECGVLRVGYNPNQVPFSYFNAKNELVGFDISMMHQLARDLGVSLEFVPYERNTAVEDLESGFFDLAISGLQVSARRLQYVGFTDPVLELTMGLVVKDHREEEFSRAEHIKAAGRLKIATVGDYPGLTEAEERFDNIEIAFISSNKDFFENADEEYDALLTSLESGMAWTVLYPEYTAVFFKTKLKKFPVAYAVAKGNLGLQIFLNSWLSLQRSTGKVGQFYEYWIHGKDAVVKTPRWSIIKNVLGWVE